MSQTHKVVFLDDGSVTARRLKRALVACGYVYLEASDDATLREHLAKGAEAILHVPTHPHKFVTILNRLCKEQPRTPVVHIVEEANFQGSDWLKSPFHEWLDITTTVQSLIRRVENLVHFSKLETQLSETQKRAMKIDQFMRAIGTVDVQLVVKRAIEIFNDEFPCENVLWFEEGMIAEEAERFFATQTIPLDQRKPCRNLWSSAKEFSRADLEAVFSSWSLTHGKTWGQLPHPRELNGRDFVLPVRALKVDGYGQPIGYLVFVAPKNPETIRAGEQLEPYLDLLAQQLMEALEYQHLVSLTYKDDLTDLYNQRYLPIVLDQELQRAQQTAKEFSVLFCDVDFFKTVNDTKGHMVGSRVLVELSRIFKSSIRSSDFAFRYGGDEYVIVLSGANSKHAALVAERLRQKAADATFDINGNKVKITVSIGIATYPEHAKSADEILHMADEAMYYGKHKSRNVIHIAS
jgi:diguanylate cyclase (GGDEF)-like protein